jgi:WLM domain
VSVPHLLLHHSCDAYHLFWCSPLLTNHLLQGFRRYQKIRETLVHELTHMVWGDHDNNFKQLNSQLLREAAQLDWTAQPGGECNMIARAYTMTLSSMKFGRAKLQFVDHVLTAVLCLGQAALQAAMQGWTKRMPACWGPKMRPGPTVWVTEQTLRQQLQQRLPQRCSARSRRRLPQQRRLPLAASWAWATETSRLRQPSRLWR